MISFVIPVYNRKKYVNKAINSVLSQKLDEWELIIIDDGSDDGLKSEINGYLADPRIHYYYQQNGGVSKARNTGLKMSNGDYIIFLDSDDIVSDQLLVDLQNLEYWEYDVICWKVEKIDQSKKTIKGPQNLGPLYNNQTLIFLAGSVCYKREILLAIDGYNENLTFGENFEMGMRLSQKNLNIGYLKGAYLKYISNSNERVSNSYKNRFSSLIIQYKSNNELYKRFPKIHADVFYKLGFLAEKNQKLQAAKTFYFKSIRLNPYRLKVYMKMLSLKF